MREEPFELHEHTLLHRQEQGTRPMELTDTDRIAIRSVIEQQLEAFQKDDATLAFSFASPGVQQQFGNPETFLDMVKSSYFPVYRPRSVMFEDIATIEGNLSQQVVILGPDGGLLNAYYLMEKQADASWRIHGCLLMPLEGQGI